MAKRPVFIILEKPPYYKEIFVDFIYYSGFSKIQKTKSIESLHNAFLKIYPSSKILEISSKSDENLGIQLSAFNLTIETKNQYHFSVEAAFQSSKVFKNGGPYRDLLYGCPRDAKKDIRLVNSGDLIYFDFFGKRFHNNPKTYFYNWLYINSLNLHKELCDDIMHFNSFTDIVFNPDKSINCQAMAAAIYVSLRKLGLLDKALENPKSFLEIVYGNEFLYNNEKNEAFIQIMDINKKVNTNLSDYEQLNLWDDN